MKYKKTITLKDGRTCILRNATATDGEAVYNTFNKTHDETDFLLSYSDENSFNIEQEGEFLGKTESSNSAVEIVAEIDGVIVGTAGIEPVGAKYKVRHRADFGIGIEKEYWGLGIGTAMLASCIECAKTAGYRQLELNAVSDNDTALNMYKRAGFVEFGRNPLGFNSKYTGYQELVYMRLEL